MTPVSDRYDVPAGAATEERERALTAAADAVRRGELVVLPTDTVYGVAADAFSPRAVAALLRAKGRGRQMPPPVLVSARGTLEALASGLPTWAQDLVEEYWPGPLTVVCVQQESLHWDLGETKGTVAVRMPDHELALDLLSRTGPLAVSSANLTGHPAALDADAAEEMLGQRVRVLLDGGRTPGTLASSIVDCTGPAPVLLREGALSHQDLDAFLTARGVSREGPDPRA